MEKLKEWFSQIESKYSENVNNPMEITALVIFNNKIMSNNNVGASINKRHTSIIPKK